MTRIAVFCGSSAGNRPTYRQAAADLARALARRGFGLVFGGAQVGLMGVLADAMLEQRAEVIGVIPQALLDREIAHVGVADLRVVGSMHERKALMVELSDGFIALPGGYGTLEEFCEVLTWAQLGLHGKPCGLLDVDAYFDPLLALFDEAVAAGFLRSENRALVLRANDPEALLDQFASYKPVVVPKWITPAQA
ncbi:MAG TPA: TIGR00730 family Rossman fold protein [Candidatus Dormibacteraeota bacterium]|nr:TIGR00730 family Rossman fold protein [Candidatus Dormibacteraeota bacterium]